MTISSSACVHEGLTEPQIAWQLTNHLVCDAQEVFLPVWDQTRGNDGYVSFEVDPLLEGPELKLPHQQRVSQYIELGRQWSASHKNRLIKVPATPAGLDALERLAAAGVKLNVTLIFTARQYRAARDAIWRGAGSRADLGNFKSVYSIFVSRINVYTEKAVPELSPAAQGMVGILNARRVWAENQAFWAERPTPLDQEIVFASTGTKKPGEPPWKYVEALAGSDIETNPPATNEAIAHSGLSFTRRVEHAPPGSSGSGDRSARRYGTAGSHVDGGRNSQICAAATRVAGTDCRETPGPCRPGVNSVTIRDGGPRT